MHRRRRERIFQGHGSDDDDEDLTDSRNFEFLRTNPTRNRLIKTKTKRGARTLKGSPIRLHCPRTKK
jgi:hypothetical protein